MLKHAHILICLMVWLHPHGGVAEDALAFVPEADPVKQMDDAWQTIRDFEETRYFSVAGPPMQQDAERAANETKLFEDMVEHYDDLEDEDDEYLFVIESLFDPENVSRPASLRMDNMDEAKNAVQEMPASTSMYIDSVRPTFLPGTQIKPRMLEPEKKDVTSARSLFADILRPKADEIMNEEVKPILAVDEDKPADGVGDKLTKAGTINAPPKQRVVSPDEETLNQLKQAVKELGLEKQLNLGSGADGHQVLENKDSQAHPVEANNTTTTAPATIPEKSVANKVVPAVNKKPSKPRKPRRAKNPPEVTPVPAPPPKEESIFDIF